MSPSLVPFWSAHNFLLKIYSLSATRLRSLQKGTRLGDTRDFLCTI
jgi:hypothetical protein